MTFAFLLLAILVLRFFFHPANTAELELRASRWSYSTHQANIFLSPTYQTHHGSRCSH